MHSLISRAISSEFRAHIVKSGDFEKKIEVTNGTIHTSLKSPWKADNFSLLHDYLISDHDASK